MSVLRIEALLDSLAHLKGYSTTPDGELYQIRNPLGLGSFSRPGKNDIDSSGRRVFKSDLAGRRACLFDLDLKVRGESRAGLKKDDLLENLLRVYGVTELGGQKSAVKFLKRALKDENISITTPLTYFVEEN